MKRLFILVVCCLLWCPANATSCEEDMAAKFEQTWNEYYASALVKDAQTMEKYFNFPLKLDGVYHNEKPTLISRKFFLKNYSLIFVKNKVTEHTNYYLDFLKLSTHKLTDGDFRFLDKFCSGKITGKAQIQFGIIIFDWRPKSGWKIIEILYDPDDKENLFDSVNNPDMEYAFP